jgi:hypothetical protein
LRPELPCWECKRESSYERHRFFCSPGQSATVHGSSCHPTRPFHLFSGAKADASASGHSVSSMPQEFSCRVQTAVHRHLCR